MDDLSPALVQAVLSKNFKLYSGTSLRILTPEGHIVPFRLFPEQLYFDSIWNERDKQGQPKLFRICKARKRGMSSYAVGRLEHTIQYANRTIWGSIYGHDSESSSILFQMFKRFYESHPDGERKPLVTDTTKEVRFKEGHYVKINTVGSAGESRGGSANFLIATEVSKYAELANAPSARKYMSGLKSGIKIHSDTVIVEESTSNGMDDYWYAEYKRSEDLIRTLARRHGITTSVAEDNAGFNLQYKLLFNGLWPADEYFPIFIPWFWNQENSIPVNLDTFEELSNYEQEIMGRYHLTLEQIAWRRQARKLNCDGDEEMTRQEYPCSAEESFLKSGRPFFNDTDKLQVLRVRAESDEIRDKLKSYDLKYVEAPVTNSSGIYTNIYKYEVEAKESTAGDWIEYSPPDLEWLYRYCIGVDSAEGKEDSDYDSIIVFDRVTRKIVAYLMQKVGFYDLDDYVIRAAVRYGYCDVLPERNDTGRGLLMNLVAKYPNVLKENRTTKGEDEINDFNAYGLRMDKPTKQRVTHLFYELFRDLPSSTDGSHIPFIDLISQMETFVRGANQLPAAAGKSAESYRNYDDLVMATCLALEADRLLGHAGLYPRKKDEHRQAPQKPVHRKRSRGL